MNIGFTMKYNAIYLLSLLAIITACSSSQSSNEESEKREYLEQVNQVDFKILALEDFEQEFISNGKLEAAERVVLKFKVGGQVVSLRVKNDSYASNNLFNGYYQIFCLSNQHINYEIIPFNCNSNFIY